MCVVLCLFAKGLHVPSPFTLSMLTSLIRPGDAQKYVSRRSFVLFSFVTLYLFRVRIASSLYIVIFSCTDRRKDV